MRKINLIFILFFFAKYLVISQQNNSNPLFTSKKEKISGAILLNKNLEIDAKLYLKSLNDNWPIFAKILAVGKGKFSFEAEGFKVEIAQKKVSYSAITLKNANKNNLLWPLVLKPSLQNKAYYEINIEAEKDQYLDANKLFSKVCTILLSTKEAISIYCNVNQLLIPKEFYIIETLVMKKDVLPLRNWLIINNITAGEFTNSYTIGLSWFGYNELEIINSKKGVAKNENIIYNIASYVLEKHVKLNDNERLNVSGDGSYMVYISEGVHVASKSVKIVVK